MGEQQFSSPLEIKELLDDLVIIKRGTEMRDRDSCPMPGKLLPPSKRLSQVTEKRERHTVTYAPDGENVFTISSPGTCVPRYLAR